MPAVNAQVRNGELVFKSAYHKAYFQDKFEGKDIKIINDDIETPSLRKFFEGPVVHYFYYQHEPGVFKNFRDAREALKRRFNPHKVFDLETGKWEVEAGSTSGKSKQWWTDPNKSNGFLDRIERYFVQNGYEFPDSEDYNEWLKKGPLKNEIYPPLLALIESHREMVHA